MINPRYGLSHVPILRPDEGILRHDYAPAMTRRLNAPKATRARGRPKGSGIDDAARLAAIKRMLLADRSLKPTTAIKRAGVTDPSAIRRLREKLRVDAGERGRLPAVALAAPRPETVTAELPQQLAPAEPVQTERSFAASKHPPLAAETEKRTREALLLAAYLEAMSKASPPTDANEPILRRAPEPAPHQPEQTVAPSLGPEALGPEALGPKSLGPKSGPQPAAPQPRPEGAQAAAPEPPAQAPFSFPGMPPFLQPFRQPQAAPQPGTSQGQQLEGMKLAVEAMTSMTKLQLHITENAFAYSPLALMLQGQAMVGQMLLASFTGQLDAMKPKKPK